MTLAGNAHCAVQHGAGCASAPDRVRQPGNQSGECMEAVLDQIIAFLESHQSWAPYLAFLFAFAETLAFISIVIPSTAILVGVGGLVATGALTLFPIWVGASLGALCGSMLSFWLGHRYGARMLEGWPFDRHPGMVARGTHVFQKWGRRRSSSGISSGRSARSSSCWRAPRACPGGRSCWRTPRGDHLGLCHPEIRRDRRQRRRSSLAVLLRG